jgi:hypothetical protein
MRRVRIAFIIYTSASGEGFTPQLCAITIPLPGESEILSDFNALCNQVQFKGLTVWGDKGIAEPMRIPGSAGADASWIAPHCIQRIDLLEEQGGEDSRER